MITGVLKNAAAVFATGALGSLWLGYQHGEIHDFSMLYHNLDDAAVVGIGAMVGWLFLKSPLRKASDEAQGTPPKP